MLCLTFADFPANPWAEGAVVIELGRSPSGPFLAGDYIAFPCTGGLQRNAFCDKVSENWSANASTKARSHHIKPLSRLPVGFEGV